MTLLQDAPSLGRTKRAKRPNARKATIPAVASKRTQPPSKGGRKFGPQSLDVAITEGLIEAIIALVGTEKFEAEHERGQCHVLITRRELREARERRRIQHDLFLARLQHLERADERLILAMRDHRRKLRERVIPEVQANYLAAEAFAS